MQASPFGSLTRLAPASSIPRQLHRSFRAATTLGVGALSPSQGNASLSPATATQRAATALSRASLTQAASRERSTDDRVRKALAELQSWISSSTPAEWGIDQFNIGPSELLWYLAEHWLPNHGRKCSFSFPVFAPRLPWTLVGAGNCPCYFFVSSCRYLLA